MENSKHEILLDEKIIDSFYFLIALLTHLCTKDFDLFMYFEAISSNIFGPLGCRHKKTVSKCLALNGTHLEKRPLTSKTFIVIFIGTRHREKVPLSAFLRNFVCCTNKFQRSFSVYAVIKLEYIIHTVKNILYLYGFISHVEIFVLNF